MVIVTRKYGQLGNRLFPFAHLISHASIHGYSVYNLAFLDYSQRFEKTRNKLLLSYPESSATGNEGFRRAIYYFTRIIVSTLMAINFTESRFHKIYHSKSEQTHMGDDFAKEAASKVVIIENQYYMRSQDNLFSNRCSAVEFLRPVQSDILETKKHILRHNPNDNILVGVHFRGGDYRTWMDGIYFIEPSEYIKSMLAIQELNTQKPVTFMVCSNEEVSHNFQEEVDVFTAPTDPIQGMISLSLCDYILCGFSTYSLWASYYGNVPLYCLYRNKLKPPTSMGEFSLLDEETLRM